MKNVIIRQVFAVGMHHSGVKQLEVGPVYSCTREADNPRDNNAIAVYSDEALKHRVCYLHREDSRKLKDLIVFAKGLVHLRAKFGAEQFSRFKEPMQNCSIGFKCSDDDCAKLQPLLNVFKLKWTDKDMANAVGAVKIEKINVKDKYFVISADEVYKKKVLKEKEKKQKALMKEIRKQERKRKKQMKHKNANAKQK